MPITVRVDIRQLTQFKRVFVADLRFKSNGPIRQAFGTWGELYREFIRARYDRLSRGGGSWPPLAPSTVARKGHGLILRDTDTLYEATQPFFVGKPGQLNQHVPFGIAVGIRPGGAHPTAGMDINELALIHQNGVGSVPARPIIVAPTPVVVNKMADAMNDVVMEVAQKTGVM